MAKTDEALKSYQIFLKYKTNNRSKWANQAFEDRAFKAGAMWDSNAQESIGKKGQIVPITNEIIPTINLVVAQLTENNPRFYAVGRERSDTKTAAAYADTMAYIWDISDGNAQFDQHVTDFEDIGIGGWLAYVDPHADNGNGEIKIMTIDPMELYLDPNSKDPNGWDSEHMMIVKHLSEGTIKLNYPNINLDKITAFAEDDKYSTTRGTPVDQILDGEDDEENKYMVIDRYTKIKVKRYHVLDPSSGFERVMTEKEYLQWAEELAVIETKLAEERYITESEEVEELLEVIRTVGTTYHLMVNPDTGGVELMQGVEHGGSSIPNSTTQLRVVTKGDLVTEGKIEVNLPLVDRVRRVFSVGRTEISNYIMEVENYPIVLSMLHHMRHPFPMGDIRLVKSLQEQLNKIDNLIITYNQNITNVKMFVPKGSGTKKEIDKRGGNAGTEVFEYDPELGGVPIVVQLTQMSNSLYQQRENIIRQIQRIVGAYAFQDGDVSRAPETKGGTVLLDEMMQRRTAWKRRKLERALDRLGSVVAQLIPQVYRERKIVRIIRPNRPPKETVLNDFKLADDGTIAEAFNDMSVGRYDIKMVSGSSLPTNKMQRREEKMRLYELGLLQDPEWYIRDMDEPDVEEILEREGKLRQAEQTIQQLQEQIKDLDGQLQTKSREVIQANEKVAVEKTKSKLDKAVSKVEADTQLTKARLNDLVKNQKASKEA